MIDIIIIAIALVVCCFAFVVLVGAPFVPTLKPLVNEAFALLDLKPGQKLLELGSGDGRLLVAAAQRGIIATGYEINPLLFAFSWLRILPYRGTARVYCRNFWRATLPETDGIFVFLLDKYMRKLDKKIAAESNKPIKLVSFAFKIPGKKSARESGDMFMYEYKA